MAPTEVKALVVCLGNICRSPMGEAVLKHVAKQRGLDITVDSAGTAGYHIGEECDERTTAVCKKVLDRNVVVSIDNSVAQVSLQNKVPINCLARQVSTSDFINFTHILASDENNLRHLLSIKPANATATVRLWGSYLDGRPIPDPYYGKKSGFDDCFEQCTALSNAFLDDVFGKPEQ